MAVREVIRLGHPHLRRKAKPYPVDQIGSPEYRVLIEDMRETLHAQGGIGLAAPQIDVDQRVVVIEMENASGRYGETDDTPFTVYVNPVITVVEPHETEGYWEGCLSVPGLRGYVERPQHIVVDYVNGQGKPVQVRADGFLATVFQHECDHLDGIVYVDRITDVQRFAFQEEYLEHHHPSASGQVV